LQHLEKGLAELAPDFHFADGALQCYGPHGGVTIWTAGGKVLGSHTANNIMQFGQVQQQNAEKRHLVTQ
jgi:hypothetical protein